MSVATSLDVFKALADENRIRAFMALDGRELCVCQIVELLKLAPSTVSKHLSILRHAGLIRSSKKGRWVYYEQARNAADILGTTILKSLASMPSVEGDAARLERILRLDPNMLCERQNR